MLFGANSITCSHLPGHNIATLLMPYVFLKQVSLFVRNPFEVVKQRAQAYTHLSSLQALKFTLAQEVC